MKEVDVRTLACPGPVLELRDLLDAGEREIMMRVADELSRSNVTRFAASRGAGVTVEDPGDGSFKVIITAGEDAAGARPGEDELLDCALPGTAATAGPQVVQITAETMGTGDGELGSLLMRSFIKTQAQLEHKPDLVLFYNDGVKLCCEGSVLVDDLKAMEADGIEVIACGTCLNFYGLSDQLRVGRVTDMLEIASRLAGAGTIIRP